MSEKPTLVSKLANPVEWISTLNEAERRNREAVRAHWEDVERAARWQDETNNLCILTAAILETMAATGVCGHVGIAAGVAVEIAQSTLAKIEARGAKNETGPEGGGEDATN